MARNAFGAMTGGPRSNLSANDLDFIYGRDGATGGSGSSYGVQSSPLPDLTPRGNRPQLRGGFDETAPALRGSIDPSAAIGGNKKIATASGAPLPVGKGFAQAVYERALGAGLPDPQARLAAAQAALESRHGRSGLASQDNNFFGIKAGPSWKGERASWGTGEQDSSGRGYRMQSDFRKYASPEDSFADYVGLLKRRWPEAMSAGSVSDAVGGLRFGQQGGYATDQNYGRKIEGIANGLRPPRDIPNAPPSPMDATSVAQPTSQRQTERPANMAPPEELLQQRPHQQMPQQNPQQYLQQQPYQQPQQPQRVQDFFQPVQQAQSFQSPSNAFGGDQGGGFDLASLFGGGGDFWSM
jgi:hypothetical protein